MSSTRKFCKLFKIIAGHRLKSYVDQFYVGKLLRNTRQIQSLVTQKTERRLRQAENRTLSKRKSKKSKKTTVGLPSHRASDQQFQIKGLTQRLHTPESTKLRHQISVKKLRLRQPLSMHAMAQQLQYQIEEYMRWLWRKKALTQILSQLQIQKLSQNA